MPWQKSALVEKMSANVAIANEVPRSTGVVQKYKMNKISRRLHIDPQSPLYSLRSPWKYQSSIQCAQLDEKSAIVFTIQFQNL